MIGCFGCSMAQTILTLDIMRAVTGFGGGGLITMGESCAPFSDARAVVHPETQLLTLSPATVINSDMIPFKQRGMYQAMQNILVGFGAVLGASLGGSITQAIGWRWCFLLQVPVSFFALVVGYFVLENPACMVPQLIPLSTTQRVHSAIKRLDLSGSLFLVGGLLLQLLGLTLGGNEYPWASFPVISSLVGSTVLLFLFVEVEANTKAIPMIPLRMLKGWQPIAVQLTNIFSGMASYAVSPHFPRISGTLADARPTVHVYGPIVFPGCSW